MHTLRHCNVASLISRIAGQNLIPRKKLQVTYSPSAFCAFLNLALFLSSSLLSSCLAAGPVLAAAGALTPENLTLRPCIHQGTQVAIWAQPTAACSWSTIAANGDLRKLALHCA